MKIRLMIILIFFLLVSGCLENLTGKNVPVLYVNVTMDEDNGIMGVQAIEAYAGEMPELKAPGEQLPSEFPAVFMYAIQNKTKITYQAGRDYKGPGVYNITIGFSSEFNRSSPLGVWVQAINQSGDVMDVRGMGFNWSTQVQKKTFK